MVNSSCTVASGLKFLKYQIVSIYGQKFKEEYLLTYSTLLSCHMI